VIAMLFLIIFSALAVGFFAAVTMAAQVAHNDERALGAQLAAESGLKFIQFQLSQVSVPGDTPEDKVIEEVLKDLVAQQARSENFAGKSIVLSGKTIYYPAGASNFI